MSFWNKVKSGVSKATSEAEKQATLARLNMQIGDAKAEVRRKTGEFGGAALLLCRSGELTHPSLGAPYQDILTSEAKVKELEEQLALARSGDEAVSADVTNTTEAGDARS